MEPTNLSIEAATAVPPPRRYSRQEVLTELFERPPEWLQSIKDRYDGDWTELLEYIIANTPKKSSQSLFDRLLGRNFPSYGEALLPLHILFGAVLTWAGRREGASIVLAALKGSDRSLRLLALDHIRGICGAKLGRNGQAGAIPLSIDEVVSALGVAFKDMDSNEARRAMEYCIWLGHREYLPVLAPLRWHKDPRVFVPVLKHFVEMDCDDGTLDVIASYVLEPGIRTAKDLKNLGSIVHDLCLYLSVGTAPSKAEAHRLRAAQIASTAITEALDAENPSERLADAPGGWLYPQFLFDAVCNCPSDTTVSLLARVATNRDIDPRTRADALVRHKTLSGAVLAVRKAVIHDLFAMNLAETGSHKCIQDLAKHELITMAELVQGATNPQWTFGVMRAVAEWPRNDASDATAVQGFSAALAGFVEDYSTYRLQIRYLSEQLAAMSRTSVDDAFIRQSLEAALAGAQRQSNQPWLAPEAMKLLLPFGGGAALDLDAMNPWDATREHWRREGISWQIAAQLLVVAGAMNAEGLDGLAHAKDVTNDGQMQNQLSSVLLAGGRACSEGLRDICYDHRHDKLFSALADLVRPPITLEAVVQLGEVRFDAVPLNEQPQEAIQLGIPVYTTEGTLMQVVVYFQGQGYKFYASPQGTYMDAWAVLHAFDLFMAQLGRPERIFWLGSEQDGDEWALFVCALPERFLDTCKKLRLPVRRPSHP